MSEKLESRKFRRDGKCITVGGAILFILMFFSFSVYAQNEGKLIEKAYKQQSKKKLKNFFDAWRHEITPIIDTELSTYNDTIQQAYKAFTAFYKPHRLDSLDNSGWYNDIYKDAKYLIVRNNFKIYFADKVYYTEQDKKEWLINRYNELLKDNDSIRQQMIDKTDRWFETFFDLSDNPLKNHKQVDSIANFRPQINCGDKIPVYLTPKYDTLLNAFLGSEHLEFGTGEIMNVARAKGENEKRQNFLENFVKTYHGHWGGYWYLYSFPEAYSVTFDKDMEYAIIDFRVVYEGGEAILKREGKTWTLISSKMTWIE